MSYGPSAELVDGFLAELDALSPEQHEQLGRDGYPSLPVGEWETATAAVLLSGRGHGEALALDRIPWSLHGPEYAKLAQALRAVVVRDLISEADFAALVAPVAEVLGHLFEPTMPTTSP